MKRTNLFLMIFILLFSPIIFSKTSNIKNVIYITLDGVRWQDLDKTQQYFPKLWHKYATDLDFYGLQNSHTTMEVSSVPLNLSNVFNELHFAKKDVAIFSSSPEIINATTYSNTGNISMKDPETDRPDRAMRILNHAQRMDHPDYKSNRYDKYTFEQALHYFEKYQPKFMWISLMNADDEADKGNLQQYHRLLNYYDDALDGLFSTLKTMNLDKTTMVIVTTDHHPQSKQTWAFVMNGKLEPANKTGDIENYNTLSIRPAIEKVFAD